MPRDKLDNYGTEPKKPSKRSSSMDGMMPIIKLNMIFVKKLRIMEVQVEVRSVVVGYIMGGRGMIVIKRIISRLRYKPIILSSQLHLRDLMVRDLEFFGLEPNILKW
jgi:hypothetical protein